MAGKHQNAQKGAVKKLTGDKRKKSKEKKTRSGEIVERGMKLTGSLTLGGSYHGVDQKVPRESQRGKTFRPREKKSLLGKRE